MTTKQMIRKQCGPLARRAAFLTVAALLFATAVARTDDPAKDDGPDETWQVIYIQGKRIGYLHATTERAHRDGREVLITDVLTHMTITRFNGRLRMTLQQRTEEDEAGNLLAFTFRLDNPPVSNTRTSGRVAQDTLHLETTAGGRTTTSEQPWTKDVKSPAWQDRMLREDPLDDGESRKFLMFDPQFNKVVTITMTAKGTATTSLLGGEERALQHVAIAHSAIPGFVVDTWLDSAGEALKTESNLMLLKLETYAVSRDVALEELRGEPLDLAVATLVKVTPIPRAHETRRAVYRISMDGSSPAKLFPAGPTQTVSASADGTTVDLTVTALKPGDATAKAEESPPDEYLQSTYFLECADPEVMKLAARGAGEKTEPAEIAVALEQFVHREMKDKNYGTSLATASEVARKLEGDCTEHAVLLAAMLRAKGVPSRVAVGLVYADRHAAFAGHMWTEAFVNGVWTPLDATLGRGGIGAGHIKVSDSSLAENAPAPVEAFVPMMHLLGRMRVEVVEAE
jgi:hypothetical protein